jgi:hypothetical protein
MQIAHADRSNFASVNGGRPQNAAFSRPGARAENQQQRIAQGVRSGQMTAGETRNVEGREASINRQVAADRAANGGHLTAQEHQQINQRQNNVSRSIYNDKHNANTQAQPHAEAQHGGGGRTTIIALNRSVQRPADMFAGRSSLSPRINNDERAIDRSSCRGAGTCAQSQ